MYEMKLHDIGEGMTEGEVVQLLASIGDMIEVDQPVIEVQTDKVCAELPAPVAGRIAEILVQVGDTITVGSTMIRIEEVAYTDGTEMREANRHSPSKDQANKHLAHIDQLPSQFNSMAESSSNTSNQQYATRRKQVKAAPYTRRLAREYGLDIETIQGTGPNGRIVIEDLHRVQQMQRERVESSSGTLNSGFAEVAISAEARTVDADSKTGSNTNSVKRHVPTDGSIKQTDTIRTLESEKQMYSTKQVAGTNVIPFTGRRKQIANKMIQSMFTIPHVTHFDKIDMTQLLELKEQFQQEIQVQNNSFANGHTTQQRISIMAFILKAMTISLKEFPIFNAKLDESKGEIRLEPHVNLGVAVNTNEGLIVPVIHRAEELSIYELNKRMKDVTIRAQQNQLQPLELRGGTITISNVGPIGGMFATPIINHPEVALLAFHQLEDMPVVRKKEIVIRSMLNFSMSFDHRVADGVTAVQFTNRMKEMLENPLQLFTRLV